MKNDKENDPFLNPSLLEEIQEEEDAEGYTPLGGSLARLKKIWKTATPGQTVLVGFFLIALLGGIVLSFPFMNVYHVWTPFPDALFTATSAVCVTGLVVVDTGTYWNLAGQIFIILLIQIGGLGFMTMMSIFFFAVGKRVTLHERQVLQSSVNAEGIQGIVDFVKKIPIFAFTIEIIGGLLLAFVFVPQFGLAKGLYFGIWHSISMYCNAGFDLIGGYQSFVPYVNNGLLNITVMALIIIGGLGFAVYINLIGYFKGRRIRRKIKLGKIDPVLTEHLSLNTKIVLITSAILILGGACLYYGFEYNNPQTLGQLSSFDKIMASFFQAVTPRTAGANTIDQASLTTPSLVLTNILMLIGGSPGSTAGGIKTTCIAVIFITLWSVLMGKQHVHFMHREIPYMTVRRALCVFVIGISFILFTYIVLLVNQPELNSDYLLYEVFSAFNTVGLSCGITRDFNILSKLMLTLAMFIGRVGPMTIVTVLTSTEQREKHGDDPFKLPKGTVLIG